MQPWLIWIMYRAPHPSCCLLVDSCLLSEPFFYLHFLSLSFSALLSLCIHSHIIPWFLLSPPALRSTSLNHHFSPALSPASIAHIPSKADDFFPALCLKCIKRPVQSNVITHISNILPWRLLYVVFVDTVSEIRWYELHGLFSWPLFAVLINH